MGEKEQKLLLQIRDYSLELNDIISAQENIESVQSMVLRMSGFVLRLKKMIEPSIYSKYGEFLAQFAEFCAKCAERTFLKENEELLGTSLHFFADCMNRMQQEYELNERKCISCGCDVFYQPISTYYEEKARQYGVQSVEPETLNRKEYTCPVCGSSDRDRLILSFLERIGLCDCKEGAKLLQVAPSSCIERWILQHCPQIDYETTDMVMKGVTFQSDIQDMNMVIDESYDIIICSHVLEHVRDDKKALMELKRILKPEGILVFLVPVALDIDKIDEAWGLSEEENWRRFGQGDHCRRYNRSGLIQRLEECGFFVHCLGKSYFGNQLFCQAGLTDTSTLYVLTKDEKVKLDMKSEGSASEPTGGEKPLVSVIMSCYNHGKYVKDAIESVINQSYQNIEFLVADDGSVDDSVEEMKKYSSYFAEEYYFTDNAGGRARFLREKAKGKYIALMNSDDVWDKNKIEIQVDYMEKNNSVAACFTWCSYTDEMLQEQPNSIFLQKNRSRYEWMRFFWERGNALCHPSILIRREEYVRLSQVGNACRQLPDFFMWVDLVQHNDIHVVQQTLVKMRRYSNGIVQNASSSSKENQIRHIIEEAGNWLWMVRKMDWKYFSVAFRECMIDANASGEVEISCEKFFLMIRSDKIWIQNEALNYFMEIFDDFDIRTCFEKKYGFTKRDFWKMTSERGYAGILKTLL